MRNEITELRSRLDQLSTVAREAWDYIRALHNEVGPRHPGGEVCMKLAGVLGPTTQQLNAVEKSTRVRIEGGPKLPEDVELVPMQNSILRLEAGDILVVRVPGAISQEHANRIRDLLESRHGIKCIVLSDGTELQVLRPAEQVVDVPVPKLQYL